MDPLLRRLRRLAGPDEPDGRLLLRHAAGDPAAAEELVRRHGPLVWAAARRRLPDPADAADVFQATFLLLLQRAAGLGPAVCVGPWLYRVAALTARNLRRKNARRLARRRPLFDHAGAADPHLSADLDDALLLLGERDRAAVVLCHLQGHTRREAAELLGLPEGTLSSVLSRALAKLRTRLGDPLPLLGAGTLAVPAGLAAASPHTLSLARGVVRMFWLKKLVAGGLAAAACVGLGVGVGLAPRPMAVAADPPKSSDDAELVALRMQALLAAERAKTTAALLEAAERRRREAMAGEKKGPRIKLRVSDERRPWDASIRLEETDAAGKVVADYGCGGGKIGEVSMATHLRRALLDPNGPREVLLEVYEKFPRGDLLVVLRAVVGAGFPTVGYIGPTCGFDESDGKVTRNWGRGVYVTGGRPVNLVERFRLDPPPADSPKFYRIVQKADGGENVTAVPVTESATVMDMLAGAWLSDKDNVWVSRRTSGGKEQVLPVDLVAITRDGDTRTNYQLQPGDRVYIKPPKP